jgi:hypothetical protein
MSVDKDFLLTALLQHNYLPTQRKRREELPPIFHTTTFFNALAVELAKLPYRKGDYSGYDQVEYKLTRFNNVSRLLSLPHPLPHAKLCMALHQNWEHFQYIVENPSSYIKPCQHADGRVLVMNAYSDSVEKANRHLRHSFGMLYRVETDIANCFPSVYSHALPWALVNLDEAKKHKHDNSQWFNQIDKHLRACRRDETQGIAIGPGTSNIVTEALLARVDEKLREQGYDFTRYIDDYTCHCKTEEDAQDFVRKLEREAAIFKLQLSIKKTKVVRLPLPTKDSWLIELGHRIPQQNEPLSAYQAFQFLDFAVAIAVQHPEGSVLKYAASILANKKYETLDGLKVLNYLLPLAFNQPAILPYLEDFIGDITLVFEGEPLCLFPDLDSRLNALAKENARLGRSDGMCWALYYLGKTKAKIDDSTANEVVATGDVFSMLTLYWADQHEDLIVAYCSGLDKNDPYELDRHWALLYQLFFDGVISNPYANDEVFSVLKAHGFSLFDNAVDPALFGFEAIDDIDASAQPS